jgi:rubrerythrin
MDLENMLSTVMMRQVVRTPKGRAMLLAQAADAEDNGEAVVFDQAIDLVDDPRFKKMIARHKADEIRHGMLFRECAERQGVPIPPVPDDIKMLDHIDAELDRFFSRPLTSTDDVVRTFAILEAIEERAVVQFGIYERLYREFDPKTADVFAAVAADEERHLRYCRAIVRRYAKSEEHARDELARARKAEAIAFRRTEKATSAYIHELGIIRNPIVRAIWRTISSIDAPPRPAFAGSSANILAICSGSRC